MPFEGDLLTVYIPYPRGYPTLSCSPGKEKGIHYPGFVGHIYPYVEGRQDSNRILCPQAFYMCIYVLEIRDDEQIKF